MFFIAFILYISIYRPIYNYLYFNLYRNLYILKNTNNYTREDCYAATYKPLLIEKCDFI